MKKRTIMAIMIGFMLLSIALNWRLKENMLQGYWVGEDLGNSKPVALHVEKKELQWKDALGVRSMGWYIKRDSGVANLKLILKKDTLTYRMQLHQFDTLFLFAPDSSGDSSTSKRYKFHRAEDEQWHSLQVGSHE